VNAEQPTGAIAWTASSQPAATVFALSGKCVGKAKLG